MRINPVLFLLLAFSLFEKANAFYEIDGSAFATQDAPIPEYKKAALEKEIVVDPKEHFWGAYNEKGKLLRWGIATAGKVWCQDTDKTCRTNSGSFRIYSLGEENCTSSKYPIPNGGASMPFCMYFNGSQALHGSDNVSLGNESHGCVRIHYSDAKWLRYHFVEKPNALNNYRGTRIEIKNY